MASSCEPSAHGAAAATPYARTLDCVHCGLCLPTCPTHQVLGVEADSPRGRIYLMKQVLEGQLPTRKTQLHLDRCLTCRSCESTCPSGVDYGHLVDIGRKLVDAKVAGVVGHLNSGTSIPASSVYAAAGIPACTRPFWVSQERCLRCCLFRRNIRLRDWSGQAR